MQEELKKIFLEIVQFSKDVSPEIWAILIKQQLIHGWLCLSALIISTIGVLVSGYKTKKEGWDGPTFINIICIISMLIFAISLLFFATEGLTKLLNPAYHALMALKP